VSSGSKSCVYCGEQIRRDAKKCRYCGEWFDDSGPTSPQALPDLFDHPRLPLRNLESPSHSSAAPPTSVAPPPTTTGPAPAAQGKPPVNGFAVASLVLALVGLGVGSILALIFGYKAKDSIDKSDGGQSGRGIAIAGIVLGWIQVAALVVIGIMIAISASIPTPDERAKSALETFASAEFSYHADHGTFTDDASVLIDEYGATKLSPFDTWFIPYATEDAFCLWGKFHLDGNEQGGPGGRPGVPRQAPSIPF
jgi:Domain of unknown function (DUF4190)